MLSLVALVAAGACSSSAPSKSSPLTTGPGALSSTTETNAAPSTTTVAKLAATSPGCSATPVAAGQTQVDLKSSGDPRWYIRHIPASYSATVASAVIVDLHGYQEGASIHTVMSALGAFGEQHNFITITPQGTANPIPRWDTALGSKDVHFIGDVLDNIEKTLCVNPHRIFVSGLSNGAFMTSSMACAYADRFAAAAPVAGVISDVKACKPARAVPLITFHGTADGFVAYDGGLGKDALNLPSANGKGKLKDNLQILKLRKGLTIPQQVDGWAKRNGCDAKPTETNIASDVTEFVYNCPNNADVNFYRIAGGGHTWPGSTFSKGIANVVGVTTFSINADELMWKFFEAHPLP